MSPILRGLAAPTTRRGLRWARLALRLLGVVHCRRNQVWQALRVLMIRCPAFHVPRILTKVSDGVRRKRGLPVRLQPNTGVIIMLSIV